MHQHALANERTRKTAEAKALITQVLAAGPRPAKEVLAAAQARGITRGTLYTAKERLRVESSRRGSTSDGWEWHLPQPHTRTGQQAQLSSRGDPN
jgi:hypothetical protein